jgi:hypothetical protein
MGAGGPGAIPRPARPFLLSGRFHPYADIRPPAIPVNQLTAHDTGASVDPVARAAPAAATAAPARSPAATPDDKTGYKTADTGSASRARSALHTPDGRSEKIRNRPLGAGPRAAAPDTSTRCPTRLGRPSGLQPRADARRSDTGTAGSGRGVSPGRGPSVDTVGWPASAANDGPPRGTRGYSTGPGDGWVGRASHIP